MLRAKQRDDGGEGEPSWSWSSEAGSQAKNMKGLAGTAPGWRRGLEFTVALQMIVANKIIP
ncbi:UNVERIFIED_CONTAM: hypothetical protein FKN15_070739 [Acipenser sinensis]